MGGTLSIPCELLPLLCRDLEGKDLVSTALSCKAFLEPALDELWHHVKSFEPLLACLPDGLLEIVPNEGKRTIQLTGPVRAADLQRYQSQYAHRIRVFEIVKGQRMLSFAALQALHLASGFQPGALAPRATELLWNADVLEMIESPHTFSYLPLFQGPHVSRISFAFDPTEHLHATGVMWGVTHADSLKHLELTSIDDAILDPFIPILPWSSLQALDVFPVTVASVPILMTSPHLVKLSTDIVEEYWVPREERINVDRIKTPSRAASSSLEVLSLSTNKFEFLEIALRLLPSDNRLLSFECSIDDDMSTEGINRLFNLIQKKCNHDTVSELCVEDDTGEIAMTDPLDDDVDDFANISPLLTFSNLEALTIVLPTVRIDLTPEHAIMIPTVWGHIRKLILNTTMDNSWTLCPRIDHTHLITILRGCPRLRVLGVRFNATLIKDEPSNSLGPTEEWDWATSTLEELQVADSPILSPSRVAAFLRAHCPSIKTLEHSKYSNPRQGSLILYDERWKDVAEKLDL